MADAERGPRGSWAYLAFWRDGALDLAETLEHLPANDLDAAVILALQYGGELHHIADMSAWHIWDQRCHAADRSDRAARLVHACAAMAGQLLDNCRDAVRQRVVLQMGIGADVQAVRRAVEAAWKPWEPAAKYLAGLKRAAGAAALRKTLAEVCGVSADDMAEKHPRWLNCANGTVDLVTRELRPHNPADMITYCVPADYRPQARCPLFWSLVLRACGGDYDVAEYLVKAIGYALLGENPEQLIFFIDGPTKSGKSVLLAVARSVLGELAHESQAELITVVRHGRNARTENSIRGKRLITITETSSFMHIDEGQLKRLTGEPVISVNQHYAKTEIKAPVTWTPFVATNEMPSLTNFDDALRERIVVIPGGPTIPPEQRDKHLAERITATEREGVLAMLVAGCAEYHRSGLEMPLAVQVKTGQYRGEQDTVTNFIADTCIMLNGAQVNGVRPGIPMPQVWTAYRRWARGETHLSRNEFYEQMGRQPGVVRVDNGGSVRRFDGIYWNSDTLKWFDEDGVK